jgi:hypothetical protein
MSLYLSFYIYPILFLSFSLCFRFVHCLFILCYAIARRRILLSLSHHTRMHAHIFALPSPPPLLFSNSLFVQCFTMYMRVRRASDVCVYIYMRMHLGVCAVHDRLLSVAFEAHFTRYFRISGTAAVVLSSLITLELVRKISLQTELRGCTVAQR